MPLAAHHPQAILGKPLVAVLIKQDRDAPSTTVAPLYIILDGASGLQELLARVPLECADGGWISTDLLALPYPPMGAVRAEDVTAESVVAWAAG